MITKDFQSKSKYRVKKGAKFLDKYKPGWHRIIDVYDLAMGSYHQCILGQIYDNFLHGCDRLQINSHRATLRGFDLFSRDEKQENWDLLKDYWVDEIRQREILDK